MATELFLAHIDTLLLLILALLAFYRFNERKKDIKLIGVFCAVGAATNLAATIILWTSNLHVINIPSSIYDFLMMILVGMLYNFHSRGKHSKIILTITVCFIIFAMVNLMFFQKTQWATYTKFLESMIIVVYAINYFYTLLIDPPSEHLKRVPMFWFNTAFLIYHAGTAFLFALAAYVFSILKNNMAGYIIFHHSLMMFFNLFLFIGMYYDLKQTISIKAKSA